MSMDPPLRALRKPTKTPSLAKLLDNDRPRSTATTEPTPPTRRAAQPRATAPATANEVPDIAAIISPAHGAARCAGCLLCACSFIEVGIMAGTVLVDFVIAAYFSGPELWTLNYVPNFMPSGFAGDGAPVSFTANMYSQQHQGNLRVPGLQVNSWERLYGRRRLGAVTRDDPAYQPAGLDASWRGDGGGSGGVRDAASELAAWEAHRRNARRRATDSWLDGFVVGPPTTLPATPPSPPTPPSPSSPPSAPGSLPGGCIDNPLHPTDIAGAALMNLVAWGILIWRLIEMFIFSCTAMVFTGEWTVTIGRAFGIFFLFLNAFACLLLLSWTIDPYRAMSPAAWQLDGYLPPGCDGVGPLYEVLLTGYVRCLNDVAWISAGLGFGERVPTSSFALLVVWLNVVLVTIVANPVLIGSMVASTISRAAGAAITGVQEVATAGQAIVSR